MHGMENSALSVLTLSFITCNKEPGTVWFLVWVWLRMDPSFSIFLLSSFDGCIGLCACLLVTRLPLLQNSYLNLKQEKRSGEEDSSLPLVLCSVVTAGCLLRSRWICVCLQLPGTVPHHDGQLEE